ncbi:Resolvase domain-containing protein (plasmid) [Frigidibacter mobilis]|uniref:Resolvase domain-containing protein n=1 Tax=Frigidibacter mobilis TaxID=1335048 RepID=A0A159Z9C6_9RHOB|nr:Resolvase domain-containing protein [Frigidibacter mobilis]
MSKVSRLSRKNDRFCEIGGQLARAPEGAVHVSQNYLLKFVSQFPMVRRVLRGLHACRLYPRLDTGSESRLAARRPEGGGLREGIHREGIRRAARPARAGRRAVLHASGDSLVVWKLDRLARSLPQLIETVAALEDQGIGFRSLTEAIDTTTAGGKLIFHIFGALAEFERSVIRERTRAGLKAARDRGRKGGRPPALSTADLAAAKALLRDPEITVEDVAKRLKVSPATLYRHLPGGRGGLRS